MKPLLEAKETQSLQTCFQPGLLILSGSEVCRTHLGLFRHVYIHSSFPAQQAHEAEGRPLLVPEVAGPCLCSSHVWIKGRFLWPDSHLALVG